MSALAIIAMLVATVGFVTLTAGGKFLERRPNLVYGTVTVLSGITALVIDDGGTNVRIALGILVGVTTVFVLLSHHENKVA